MIESTAESVLRRFGSGTDALSSPDGSNATVQVERVMAGGDWPTV